jgi:hypothetical protein
MYKHVVSSVMCLREALKCELAHQEKSYIHDWHCCKQQALGWIYLLNIH